MTVAVNPVIWFEIPVVDIERAKKFYGAVLGVEFTDTPLPDGSGQMAWFPMEKGVPGAGGTLMKHPAYIPSTDGTLIYFHVPDVAATLEKAKQAGATVCLEKMSIGEYGFIGIFIDSEGGKVGVHQAPAGM